MNEKSAWNIFLKSGKVIDYINYLNCKKPIMAHKIYTKNKDSDNAYKNSGADN